jgi:hypothetical protein
MLVHIDIDSIGTQISAGTGCFISLACGVQVWTTKKYRDMNIRHRPRTTHPKSMVDAPVLQKGSLSVDPRQVTCMGCLVVADHRLELYRRRQEGQP